MLLITELIQTVCASVPALEDIVKPFAGLTLMVPLALTEPQPPAKGIL